MGLPFSPFLTNKSLQGLQQSLETAGLSIRLRSALYIFLLLKEFNFLMFPFGTQGVVAGTFTVTAAAVVALSRLFL